MAIVLVGEEAEEVEEEVEEKEEKEEDLVFSNSSSSLVVVVIWSGWLKLRSGSWRVVLLADGKLKEIDFRLSHRTPNFSTI